MGGTSGLHVGASVANVRMVSNAAPSLPIGRVPPMLIAAEIRKRLDQTGERLQGLRRYL